MTPHKFTAHIPRTMVTAENGRAVRASISTCCLVSWVEIIIPTATAINTIFKTESIGMHIKAMTMVMKQCMQCRVL